MKLNQPSVWKTFATISAALASLGGLGALLEWPRDYPSVLFIIAITLAFMSMVAHVLERAGIVKKEEKDPSRHDKPNSVDDRSRAVFGTATVNQVDIDNEVRVKRAQIGLLGILRIIPTNARARHLLEWGTLEEQEAYTRIFWKRSMMVAILVGSVVVAHAVYRQYVPAPPPKEPQHLVQPAGTVQTVQLHSGGFLTSTKSTVTTSKGVIQVYGAVTAAAGDVAEISEPLRDDGTPYPSPSKKLCIKSSIKPACYSVM